jgi:two-component system cell cycle response regulator
VTARILVIEDNPANLQLMSYLLQAFGQTVLTATDGQAGLDVARRERPDLVVCDLQMPVLDGYEVARRLRDDPALCHLPMIAITAYAMDDDRARVLAAGFDGYITKPINPETIVSQVLDFLSTKPAAVATRHQVDSPNRSATVGRAGTGGPKVLVVDNCDANLEFARSALQPFGYELTCADGPRDALPLVRKNPPDLIVCDVHMPKMGGLSFLDALKGDPQLRVIPVIMITSCTWGDHDRDTALANGAVKFLVRPLEPQQFLAEIKEVLGVNSWVLS